VLERRLRGLATHSKARDNKIKSNISIKFILFPIGCEGVSSYGNSRGGGAFVTTSIVLHA